MKKINNLIVFGQTLYSNADHFLSGWQLYTVILLWLHANLSDPTFSRHVVENNSWSFRLHHS